MSVTSEAAFRRAKAKLAASIQLAGRTDVTPGELDMARNNLADAANMAVKGLLLSKGLEEKFDYEAPSGLRAAVEICRRSGVRFSGDIEDVIELNAARNYSVHRGSVRFPDRAAVQEACKLVQQLITARSQAAMAETN